MRIIDSHLHVNFKKFGVKDIINYLNKNNIDKCVLLTWDELNPPIHSIYRSLPIDDVYEAFKQYPHRIIPFYAPDPYRDDFIDRFNIYVEKGIRGFGELKSTIRWDNNAFDILLPYLAKNKLPILFHMEEKRQHYVPQQESILQQKIEKIMNGAYNGVLRHYIDIFVEKTGLFKKSIYNQCIFFPGYLLGFCELEDRLAKNKNVKIIAHGPHFWNNISADYKSFEKTNKGRINSFGAIDRLLLNYSNLYADLSGISGFNAISRDKPKAKVFLEKHYKKLLYGTDNYDLGLKELILSFNLPKNKTEAIFSKNAEKIIEI